MQVHIYTHGTCLLIPGYWYPVAVNLNQYVTYAKLLPFSIYSARRAPNVVRRPKLGVLSNGLGEGRCTQQ